MLDRRLPTLVAAAALVAPTSLPAAAAAAGVVVTPSVVKDAEGNSDNLFPLSGDPIRYQQVIAATEFPGGPRWITHLAMRPDAASGAAFSETISDIRIDLSTTRRGPAGLSRTFAENVGPDVVVAHDGPLSLASGFSGAAGGSKAFDIVIPLSTPFYYDPAAGNLLIDFRNRSGGRTTQMDAHNAADSTARVWSDDVDSPTALPDDPFPSIGLVIAFVTS